LNDPKNPTNDNPEDKIARD